jgi:hypothetical protein
MRVFKVLSIVLLLAALPVAADTSFEPTGAAGVNVPPDPGAPVWDGPRAVLWDNGPLVTSPGTGAGGADESILQSTSLGMNVLGFGIQFGSGNSIADDFTVPAGETWDITDMTFFGYQTSAPSSGSITGLYIQIYNGQPGAGGSVIWGNLTTNVLSTTGFSNIYRLSETSPGSTARAIQAITGTVVTSLPAGTYWVEATFDGSASYSGPWAPPVTVVGQTNTGNAVQGIAGVYGPLTDTGTSGADNFLQGFPFIVEGTAQGGGGGGGGGGGTGGAAEPIPTLSGSGIAILVLAFIGIAAVLIRRRM